jgi:hypothetical protein
MRIIIETQNEGRILLEPEKMGMTEGLQQGSQAAATDAGPPSSELMNAIMGTASSHQAETLEGEEGTELLSMEESSPFH